MLEVARRHFGTRVTVLREAASIVFGGGFPRGSGAAARRAAQRAIFHVQRQLERLALEEGGRVILCDRGTVDGAAYWPGDPGGFWREIETLRESELARYAAVIHMHPPLGGHGYNHANGVRIESAVEAHVIDQRIVDAWSGHPDCRFVESSEDFTEKLSATLNLIEAEVAISVAA